MPNWCDNQLTIYGDKKAVEKFVEETYGSNRTGYLTKKKTEVRIYKINNDQQQN